ncbi:ABC transporter ATP-binding protein [Candidatus Protochlamydia phocaeensis]|uniref:ABC transporter ATP-binding protein n=1 Tax=Candidatus Protochlamydia phocaeensis TaxID=1414722 RepID=UPI00083811D4|nr:ABC transporter ATP-binding protein [Candidatus Protochlamydia phocaeensis]
MNPPKIVIDHVYKQFKIKTNDVQALENIYMEIQEGEFVCLVGPSGCGKTTLLNLIAGLDFPDKGAVYDNGRPITGPSSDRMVMFQEAALFPWLDVLDNVLFGLKLKKDLSSTQRLELAKFYLRLVGLEKFMHARVYELSGGMKQRVALARALAPDPHLLLMDEPFAALDALTREQLYDDIQKIWQKQRKTIIFVTHNVSEAVCLGDRVFLFASNPGRIKEQFLIPLPRLREIRSVEVAQFASEITHVLKSSFSSFEQP